MPRRWPPFHFSCRNTMANVEDIPFIVEDRRMLSRVAGDRSEYRCIVLCA